jgi:hypothetical protein
MNKSLNALLLLPLVVALAACPKDKPVAKRDSIPVDTTPLDTTTPTDLSTVKSNLPPVEPDTFKKRVLTPSGGNRATASVPAAPGPLMEAVQREQSFTRFCYTEFGQKSDPSLRGNVAMVVSVGASGITGARVGDSNWSGQTAGRAVNSCLNDKAKEAWKLSPGVVKPGSYVVQLSFSGA